MRVNSRRITLLLSWKATRSRSNRSKALRKGAPTRSPRSASKAWSSLSKAMEAGVQRRTLRLPKRRPDDQVNASAVARVEIVTSD